MCPPADGRDKFQEEQWLINTQKKCDSLILLSGCPVGLIYGHSALH